LLEDVRIRPPDAVPEISKMRDQQRMKVSHGGGSGVAQRRNRLRPVRPIVFSIAPPLPLVRQRMKDMWSVRSEPGVGIQANQRIGCSLAWRR
jgi:hypothetical protein